MYFRLKDAEFPVEIGISSRIVVTGFRGSLGLVGVSPLKLKAGLCVTLFERDPLIALATRKAQ
jgi:hypothetical protein